jgi:hypothetical protein
MRANAIENCLKDVLYYHDKGDDYNLVMCLNDAEFMMDRTYPEAAAVIRRYVNGKHGYERDQTNESG